MPRNALPGVWSRLGHGSILIDRRPLVKGIGRGAKVTFGPHPTTTYSGRSGVYLEQGGHLSTRFLIYVALIWTAIGVVVAFLMRRRGNDFFVWLVLGVGLGPLSVPLAIERARYHGAAEHQSRGTPTPPHVAFDILAGIDGSPDAVSAIDTAVALFGGRVSSVTLATVLDYDQEDTITGRESQTEARRLLDEAAAQVLYDPVDTIVLYGRPDHAMKEFARTSGMELIVVGARGKGATESLFGSVTARLVGGSEVPIFVGPASATLEWGATMRGVESR
jgi:nucleotide-binding universal stress UspA family protein